MIYILIFDNNIIIFLVLMKEIGKILAKMHCIDIIHGDLTTSNMILRDDNTVVNIFKILNFEILIPFINYIIFIQGFD